MHMSRGALHCFALLCFAWLLCLRRGHAKYSSASLVSCGWLPIHLDFAVMTWPISLGESDGPWGHMRVIYQAFHFILFCLLCFALLWLTWSNFFAVISGILFWFVLLCAIPADLVPPCHGVLPWSGILLFCFALLYSGWLVAISLLPFYFSFCFVLLCAISADLLPPCHAMEFCREQSFYFSFYFILFYFVLLCFTLADL